MSRFFFNLNPTGNDHCLSPVEVNTSAVILDNGIDCIWYPAAMDALTADRLTFAILHGSQKAEAFRVDFKLILPRACDLRSEFTSLDQLVSDPIRVNLRAG